MDSKSTALALALVFGAAEAVAQTAVCSDTPAAGQRIDCRQGAGSADDIRIDAMNLAIPATTTHAIYARHQGSGAIDIDISGGSLTTTGERDYAVIGWHSGASGDIDIGLKDVVARTSNADSHAVVGNSQGGMHAVRIDVQGGSITTEGSGAGSHAIVASGNRAPATSPSTCRTPPSRRKAATRSASSAIARARVLRGTSTSTSGAAPSSRKASASTASTPGPATPTVAGMSR